MKGYPGLQMPSAITFDLDNLIRKGVLFDEMLPVLNALLASRHVSIGGSIQSDWVVVDEETGNAGNFLHQSHSFTACLEWIERNREA